MDQHDHSGEAVAEFERRVLAGDLDVRSGAYLALDDRLEMHLGPRGEFEYTGLPEALEAKAGEFLAVSAFGGHGVTEDSVAEELFGGDPEVRYHHLLGHYRGLFAGHVKEGTYRERGSSGGMATWVLAELLRTGLVDGVIHMVPGQGRGPLFHYRVSRTVDQVLEGAKSRYYPGEFGSTLREVRASGGRFALTAIPSIAYELRLLQRLDEEFRSLVPYVVGLICGHQKTANYAAQLGWRLGIKPGDLESIDFRRKDPTAPASKYLIEARGLVDGVPVTRSGRQGQLFGTDWGMGLFKSNFSDFSEDAFNETADVVLGDAWLPEYVGDPAGTNVVITRNREIHELIEAAVAEGRLALDACSQDAAVRSQAALVRQSVIELPFRLERESRLGRASVTPRRASSSPPPGIVRRRIQVVRRRLSVECHAAWVRAVDAGDLGSFDRAMRPLVLQYRFWQEMNDPLGFARRAVRRVLGLKRAT